MINLTLSFASVAEMHAELASLVAILPPAPATTPAPMAIVQRAERIAAETLPPVVEQEAPKAPKASKPAKQAEVKPESPAATPAVSETVIAATTAPAEPEPVSASPSEPVAAAVTLEDVRAKLAAISQGGKQQAVKELIATYGVQALSKVPADKFSELLEKADAL